MLLYRLASLHYSVSVVHAGCQEQSADLHKQIIAVTGHSEEVTITFSYISLTNQIARNERTVFYTV